MLFWGAGVQEPCLEDKRQPLGTSLVVQWLKLCASIAGDMGSVPTAGDMDSILWGSKILQASQGNQKPK